MKKFIIKNQLGKFIYGREETNKIIHMVHNELESCEVGGKRITLQSKKSTEEGCEVVVNVEGI